MKKIITLCLSLCMTAALALLSSSRQVLCVSRAMVPSQSRANVPPRGRSSFQRSLRGPALQKRLIPRTPPPADTPP